MSDFVVTRPRQRVELDAGAALKLAWQLYKRLFARSVVMGAAVAREVAKRSGTSWSSLAAAAAATRGLRVPVVCGGRWSWRVPSIGPFGITIAVSGRLRRVLRGAR